MLFFEANLSVKDKPKSILVIFAGSYVGHEADYAYELEVGFRDYKLRPEEVLFVCPGYIEDIIREYLARKEKFYEGLLRFGPSVPVSVAFFDQYSCFKFLNVNNKSSAVRRLRGFESTVVQNGLMALASKRKDQIILKAPSGTIFLKPSRKEFSEFMKASELAVGATENQFVAFCLLSRRPKDRKVRRIYIDTNSISPYVEALLFYLSAFSKKECHVATYDSYSSYAGKDKAKPDLIDDVWLIISASRSNSMGKDMAEEWGLVDDQVLTILSYTNSDPEIVGDNILLNVSKLSDNHADSGSQGSLIKVKVVGENFTAEAEHPNSVTIKTKHKSPAISKSIEPLSSSGVFKCNRKLLANNRKLPIYVDCENYFVADKSIKNWVCNLIDWYVPIKLSHVVYREIDAASVKLKDLVVNYLRKIGVNDFEVTDIESAQSEISGPESILVLMPVTGSGETLLKLNRNLRISGHEGNRIFISPFVVHSSRFSFLDFKNSLLYGPNGFKYQFFSFHDLFIGHGKEPDSWELELDLIEQFENSFWSKRASQLRNYEHGLDGKIGVSGLRPDCKLLFSQDFAFWKPGYSPPEVNPESVYITVASILQRLREAPLSDEDTDSLFSHVYQHSVLSPENFVRFNDPLLQSCLWRAADSRELDYRSSVELSSEFIGILDRLVKENSKNRDNAAVDLLIGIAIGKIQLAKEVLLPALSRYSSLYSSGFDYAHDVLRTIRRAYDPNDEGNLHEIPF